jgi:hypothetical protein
MPQSEKTDVVVIGAMKAASSTINAYLEDHPEVFMVSGGEPNFFSHDKNYEQGLDYYTSFFRSRTTERLCSEGSNSYSVRDLFPKSAERMAAYNPDVKIVYMVRNPLDRIVSAWTQKRVDSPDKTPPTLDEAVHALPDHFIGPSRYWYNIAPFREHFSDDQIFVGFMEDLHANSKEFFAALCGFLGIAPVLQAQRPHMNKSAEKLVPTRTFDRLKRSPVTKIVKAVLPKEFQTFTKQRILSRPLSNKPEFSPKAKAEIVEILRPDARAFLRQYSKPVDFWRF